MSEIQKRNFNVRIHNFKIKFCKRTFRSTFFSLLYKIQIWSLFFLSNDSSFSLKRKIWTLQQLSACSATLVTYVATTDESYPKTMENLTDTANLHKINVFCFAHLLRHTFTYFLLMVASAPFWRVFHYTSLILFAL